MDNYLIEYEEIKNLTINEVLELVKKLQGKELKELKVKDLTYHNSEEIWPGEGVYIFRNRDEIIYVGKARSTSFTERIAKHFDFRHFAWFNRLLQLTCEKKLLLEWNDENAKKSSKYAFENFNLVLINFSDRARIDRTERLFRACAEPLNKFKNLKEKNLELIINEY